MTKEDFSKSVIDQKLKEAEDFYNDRIISWMLNDLKKSISGGTNFLTALGCLVYTEIIGNFLPPLYKENGSKEEKCFYRCFYRLPSSNYLEKINNHIFSITNKNIYQQMRHSMAHAYYPNIKKYDNGGFLFVPTVISRDGYKIADNIKTRCAPIFFDNEGRLALATRNYTNELKKAITVFYEKSFKDKEKQWVDAAIRGINYITKGV